MKNEKKNVSEASDVLKRAMETAAGNLVKTGNAAHERQIVKH